MDELFMQQELLFKMHQILITCFSFKDDKGDDKFRIYFKSLKTGYLHNPMIQVTDDKRAYIAHGSYEEALTWAIDEANNYIKKTLTMKKMGWIIAGVVGVGAIAGIYVLLMDHIQKEDNRSREDDWTHYGW